MPHIIAISNQKGGVGKTTTCVNLAACLGARGHRTLIVDMDPQGNATTAVGIDTRTVTTSLYRMLLGLDTPDPVSLDKTIAGVSILPSSMDLAGAELEFHSMENSQLRLRAVLDDIETPLSFILIDSPPSLNLLSINSLAAADSVLIPVQAEFMALEGLAHVMNTIQLVRDHYNPFLQFLGIAVTLYDRRTRLASEVVNELESTFNGKVFATRINRSVRLSEAPSYGKPILYYDPKSAAAQIYNQLSEEVFHACEKTRPGPRA